MKLIGAVLLAPIVWFLIGGILLLIPSDQIEDDKYVAVSSMSCMLTLALYGVLILMGALP